MGDHGIAPTPRYYQKYSLCDIIARKKSEGNLECREHLYLFITIQEIVMVLHRDERGEFIRNSIIYR